MTVLTVEVGESFNSQDNCERSLSNVLVDFVNT